MARSITLSHVAIDILLERHSLGPAPFPFEITNNGRTETERAGIRDAVLADLNRRNLDERQIGDMLRIFVQPRVAITAFGKLGGDHRLFMRVCSTDRFAIRAVGESHQIRLESVEPTGLVSSAVAVIPNARPGEGQSIVLAPETPADQPEKQGFSRMVRPPRTGRASRLDMAARMLARPKLRLGQFRIVVRGRHGREDASPDLFWFDTDAGRYAVFSSAASDGQIWTTCTPADNARIANYLSEQLDRLYPNG